jgi:RNA polymerase sigma factor (sigma-70 family)
VAGRNANVVLAHLRKLTAARATHALSDRELLDRFLAECDEAAFAALVERHGAMVLGICRRVLRHAQDAEDACQAAFLVLARKAGSIRKKESLASWLHGVAHHVATNLKRDLSRRAARETLRPEATDTDVAAEVSWREIQGLLDDELARLPEQYRSPLILCYLEGMTRDEAAQQLGWRLATFRGRLERGRERLRARLTRRGLTLSAALFGGALAEGSAPAAVPPALVVFTVQAGLLYAAGKAGAAAGVSARVAALAQGALRALFAADARTGLTILAVLLAAGLGFGLIASAQRGADPADKNPQPPAPAPQRVDGPPPAPALTQPVADNKPADPAGQADRQPDKGVPGAGDWPQWRGPNRDGAVVGVTVPEKWPQALKEEWQAPVGRGVASPVVAGDSVYVFTRQKEDELVLCLDLQSGKENWRSEPYRAPYKVGPGEGPGEDRPRSTPAVADGRVFTLGMTGVVSCLDAATGKLLWRKQSNWLPYGGTSPLVTDGLCVVHVGDDRTDGLTAYDVKTGEVKWCYAEGSRPMSGSPIVADLAGERQVVSFSFGRGVGVSVASGKKLWREGPGGGGQPCTTPVQYKDLLILNEEQQPLRALRLEKGDKGLVPKEVWKSKDLPLYYSSPVVVGDLVFGMSTRNGGCFFCLDAPTGKTLWESDGKQGGYASFVSLGSVLLILKDRGQLLVVKPSAAAFEVVAEYQVSDRATMAHPVFLGDRLLIKDDQTLRCFRVEQAKAGKTDSEPR